MNYSPLTLVFAWMVLAVAMVMTLTTTILGWIAVSQIRRSAGQLRGLGLAVFDGLLFPMLALNALIVGITLMGIRVALISSPASRFGSLSAGMVLAAIFGCIVVDYFIIRGVWRAVNGRVEKEPAPSAHKSAKILPKWMLIAGSAIVLGLAIWFAIPSRFYPASSMHAAFVAPVIGRIQFEVSDTTGKTGSSYDVKAWGDTQWSPTLTTATSFFRTRVDASRSAFPVAWATTSADNEHWEVQEVNLGAGPSSRDLYFSNGRRVSVTWTPVGPHNSDVKRPNKTQQQVMLEGSELSDKAYPVAVP